MSKKRSLGSSPIGFESDDSSMGFIPDLGSSESEEVPLKDSSTSAETKTATDDPKNDEQTPKKEKKSKKKIVSYNLEVELINRVKSMAKNKDMYYSSLVSVALKHWLTKQG